MSVTAGKIFYGALFFLIIFLSSCGLSKPYEPIDSEKTHYVKANKNIWPDDLRKNGIENYHNTFIVWVGIVDEYEIENNIIKYTMKHHYYDWIEDFGYKKGPFLLSPDGEGYIVGNHVLKSDITEDVINELVNDFIGDCIVLYGYPKEILNDGKIVIDTKYSRRISKKYVDPNWIAPSFKKYGRDGLE